MTRIYGFTDYIGPSGGVKCNGYYHLYANRTILASGQDMYLDFPDGIRPKVNGSGIVCYDEVLPKARFFANLDVKQDISTGALFQSLTWDASLNDGFTFSNGDSKVYLKYPGQYFINVYLTNDLNMGGGIMFMQLRYYDGFSVSPVGIRQAPTVAALYNTIDVTYVANVTNVAGTYFDVQARLAPNPEVPGQWQDGTKCGFSIIKV